MQRECQPNDESATKVFNVVYPWGGELEDAFGAPHTPIYNTTTFAHTSTKSILEILEGTRSGALYTRYGLNPTIQALEHKLAGLEKAEAALAFASGMAADALVETDSAGDNPTEYVFFPSAPPGISARGSGIATRRDRSIQTPLPPNRPSDEHA